MDQGKLPYSCRLVGSVQFYLQDLCDLTSKGRLNMTPYGML